MTFLVLVIMAASKQWDFALFLFSNDVDFSTNSAPVRKFVYSVLALKHLSLLLFVLLTLFLVPTNRSVVFLLTVFINGHRSFQDLNVRYLVICGIMEKASPHTSPKSCIYRTLLL
jgi:predicted membrane metal-binding protein